MYIKCSLYAFKMRKPSKFPLETLTRMYEKMNKKKKIIKDTTTEIVYKQTN